jgi:hypothetical protein
MSSRRVLGALAISAVAVFSLSACFLLPSRVGGGGNGGTGDDTDLVGTSWSGVDSDGDGWGMTFQEDGTVGVELNGNSFDDDTDTWRVDDGVISIDIALTNGPASFVGDFDGVDSPIELDGEVEGHEFTLTLERD